jgi:hypothetical protein
MFVFAPENMLHSRVIKSSFVAVLGISLVILFASVSRGQTPSQTPIPTPSQPPADTDSGDLTKGLVEDLLGPAEESSSNKVGGPKEPSDSENPLATIRNRMIAASTILLHGDVSSKSLDVQTKILGELDELIDQIRKESQEESKKKNSSQKSQSTAQGKTGQQQRSNAKLPTSIPDEKKSQSPQVVHGNQPGEAQLNSGQSEVNLAENIRLGEGVWGHLPERVRRQMIASGAVKFLPKYQTLIEEYYRRIADDNASSNRKKPN